jgi:O-antigen ligase
MFVYLFPFGTGEFVWRDYQASPAIPSRFAPAGITSPLRPFADVARKTYLDSTFGATSSEAHNAYLEHVLAYGALGVVGVIVFVGAILVNYRRSRASPNLPRAFVFAVLGFFGFFFMFYSFPKVYVAYMFFFQASFVLSHRDAPEAA